jgi:hypothetical protein
LSVPDFAQSRTGKGPTDSFRRPEVHKSRCARRPLMPAHRRLRKPMAHQPSLIDLKVVRLAQLRQPLHRHLGWTCKKAPLLSTEGRLHIAGFQMIRRVTVAVNIDPYSSPIGRSFSLILIGLNRITTPTASTLMMDEFQVKLY